MAEYSKIEKFWYSKSPLRWLLLPISLLIQLIALIKRFFYQSNIIKVTQNRVPVIVVGNITIGGTGKTPMIMSLVKYLQSKDLSVGIVSRGYLSQIVKQPHLVNEVDTAIDVGDEAFMLFNNLKVPMAIGRNRAQAINLLNQHYQLDYIISDDGLQHYAMARDYELLMIDSTRCFGNNLMMPFGPLREPTSRIKSVDFIIFNGNDLRSEDLKQNLNKLNRPNCTMTIKVSALINLNNQKSLALSELDQYTICAVAGIGNPQRFLDSLSQYSHKYTTKIFIDHHDFKLTDFEDIKEDIIIMTEKDAVKCQSFAKDNWYYLQVDASLNNNDLENLYQSINNKITNHK